MPTHSQVLRFGDTIEDHLEFSNYEEFIFVMYFSRNQQCFGHELGREEVVSLIDYLTRMLPLPEEGEC